MCGAERCQAPLVDFSLGGSEVTLCQPGRCAAVAIHEADAEAVACGIGFGVPCIRDSCAKERPRKRSDTSSAEFDCTLFTEPDRTVHSAILLCSAEFDCC